MTQNGVNLQTTALNQGGTLHLWASDDAWTSFTAHSDPDGSYSGTLSLKTGDFEVGLADWMGLLGIRFGGCECVQSTLPGFSNPCSNSNPSIKTPPPPLPAPPAHPHPKKAYKTPADFEALLTAKFSGVPPDWIPQIAAQAAGQRPSPAGKRTRCSRLDGPACVLIGDAAHSVTPVFGQVCVGLCVCWALLCCGPAVAVAAAFVSTFCGGSLLWEERVFFSHTATSDKQQQRQNKTNNRAPTRRSSRASCSTARSRPPPATPRRRRRCSRRRASRTRTRCRRSTASPTRSSGGACSCVLL